MLQGNTISFHLKQDTCLFLTFLLLWISQAFVTKKKQQLNFAETFCSGQYHFSWRAELLKTNSDAQLAEEETKLWGKHWQFLSLLLFYFGGGWRLLQEIASLKTTQRIKYLGINPDLDQVTAYTRMPWRPKWWGVGLFRDRCSLYHPVGVQGLFLCWSRQGHCSILIMLLLCSEIPEVDDYSK